MNQVSKKDTLNQEWTLMECPVWEGKGSVGSIQRYVLICN